jgi:hypothetical protein
MYEGRCSPEEWETKACVETAADRQASAWR